MTESKPPESTHRNFSQDHHECLPDRDCIWTLILSDSAGISSGSHRDISLIDLSKMSRIPRYRWWRHSRLWIVCHDQLLSDERRRGQDRYNFVIYLCRCDFRVSPFFAIVRWFSPITFWRPSTNSFTPHYGIPNIGILPGAPRPRFPFILPPSMTHQFQSLLGGWRKYHNPLGLLTPWIDRIDRKRCYRWVPTGEQIPKRMYRIRKVGLRVVP